MKIIFDHSHGLIIDNRVFCEAFVVPENETYDDLIEFGWLPSVQPPIYWYQSKSCRVNYDKIKFSYKREKIILSLSYEIIKYVDHKIEVDNFFDVYFCDKDVDFKLYYDKNSNFDDISVLKVIYNEQVVGYTRFLSLDRNILGLETSYVYDYPKMSLGINSIVLLSKYVKQQNKSHLYIYESYADYFPYKLEVPGVEFWEGEKWI